MMDILKILTRSTNLQKSLPAARQSSEQQIPSAGALQSRFQDSKLEDGGNAVERTEPLKKGTKRKRRELRPIAQADDVYAPDLFKIDGGNGQKVVRETKAEKNGPQIAAVGENSQAQREIRVRMTEEECRKLLKTHKLKITVMKDRDESIRKESKRRKTTILTKPGKKDAFTQIFPQPLTSFKELRTIYGISRRLAENLAAQGYATPTEVQLGSLPLLLGFDQDRGFNATKQKSTESRSDVDLLTIAPTGSGKTLAFLIPILHGILRHRHGSKALQADEQDGNQVKAIIIAPTHELADQIVNEAKKLAIGTGIKVAGMQKGLQLHHDANTQIEDEGAERVDKEVIDSSNVHPTHVVKADVLISTPLMLLHAISTKENLVPKSLPGLLYLVLDEADVLLEPLFRSQTLAIWNACTNPALQVSLWSATIGSSIENIAQSVILERRNKLKLSKSRHHLLRLVAGLKDSALPTISHRLVYAATEQGKLLAIRQLLHPTTSESSAASAALRPPFLVFTQTIPRAIALHSELLYDIPLEAGGSSRIAVLHSDLSDLARSNVMAAFRKGEIWVLITTDLLSRGVDFRGMNGVVNYDIPNTSASYIHRAGRTGRAGREGGIAITLYTKEDIPYVKNIANVIAVSEKVHGKACSQGGGVQKWLLDALPTLSKKTKQELKKGGVTERRTAKGGGTDGRNARRMRISTKSGFDRKMENRRKGAKLATQRRAMEDGDRLQTGGSDDEWGGIDDSRKV